MLTNQDTVHETYDREETKGLIREFSIRKATLKIQNTKDSKFKLII